MKQSPESKFKDERGPIQTTVTRLENILQIWEESMAFERLGALLRNQAFDIKARLDPNCPSAGLEGPVVHYQDFRKHVLSMHSANDFDSSRFGRIKRIRPVSELQKTIDHLAEFIPLSIARWRLESSRVYNPSADLEVVLSGTKLGDMAWEDLDFPFNSYGISLPVPIYLANSEKPCDFLLVSVDADDEGDKFLTISIFPQFLGNFRQTPRKLVEKVEADIRAGAVDQNTCTFAGEMGMNTTDRSYSFVRLPISNGEKINDTLAVARQEGFEQVLQIVGGFSMYLSTLRKDKARLKSEWKPALTTKRKATPDESAITDGSQICSVSFEYTLTPELRKKLNRKYIRREEGVEMPAGFVQAYWRRKRGTGNDPDAPRCEHVNSYAKGFDRLLDGTLPAGSQVDLK